MKQPFFSIVMPAYNAENSIQRTIKSILNQNFQDFELIIVNDGSIDSTEKIVESYTEIDSRIKILTIKNGGPGNARNIGIQLSTGHYLYMMDSDDELPQNTLRIYETILKETNSDLIVSSYQLNVMDKGKIVERKIVKAEDQSFQSNTKFLENLYPLMNKQLMYVIWNKVYRLDIIKKYKINFPPYSSCEDRIFNIRYYQYINKIKIISDILYSYSFEGRYSLTNKFLLNKFDTFVEFYVELKKLTLHNIEGTSALFLKGVMSCIIPLHSPECPLAFRQKLKYINDILYHRDVIEATAIASENSLTRKLLNTLFSSRSKILIYIASKAMYIVSHTSPKVIEKLKGNF